MIGNSLNEGFRGANIFSNFYTSKKSPPRMNHKTF